MALPVVPLDTPHERQHRTAIATSLNELVKFINRITGTDTTEFARYADTTANFTGSLQSNGEEVGYKFLQTGTSSTTNVTLVQADNDRLCFYLGTGGHVISLGTLTAGTRIMIANGGSGNVSVQAPVAANLSLFDGSGAIPTGDRTLAVGGWAIVRTSGSGVWRIFEGAGVS